MAWIECVSREIWRESCAWIECVRCGGSQRTVWPGESVSVMRCEGAIGPCGLDRVCQS